MTTTPEKFNALRNVREFLNELVTTKQHYGVRELRGRVLQLLKHYPWDMDLERWERLASIEGDGWRAYADRKEEEEALAQREGEGL